ncbi:MAG TPA: hypothetical protein VI413_09285 [Paludibacter sp.]
MKLNNRPDLSITDGWCKTVIRMQPVISFFPPGFATPEKCIAQV